MSPQFHQEIQILHKLLGAVLDITREHASPSWTGVQLRHPLAWGEWNSHNALGPFHPKKNNSSIYMCRYSLWLLHHHSFKVKRLPTHNRAICKNFWNKFKFKKFNLFQRGFFLSQVPGGKRLCQEMGSDFSVM